MTANNALLFSQYIFNVGKLRNGLTFFNELAPYIRKVEK
jgi:hypothetical protein